MELQTRPTADVTVTITGVSGGLRLDKTSLVFTQGDWRDPQDVEVAAVDDDDSAQDPEVTLTHQNGSLIKFDSAGNVTITAVSGATINAPSGLTVNAPTSTFPGAVICQPLTATSVTSPVYSPGAGNVW